MASLPSKPPTTLGLSQAIYRLIALRRFRIFHSAMPRNLPAERYTVGYFQSAPSLEEHALKCMSKPAQTVLTKQSLTNPTHKGFLKFWPGLRKPNQHRICGNPARPEPPACFLNRNQPQFGLRDCFPAQPHLTTAPAHKAHSLALKSTPSYQVFYFF